MAVYITKVNDYLLQFPNTNFQNEIKNLNYEIAPNDEHIQETRLATGVLTKGLSPSAHSAP